MAVTEQQAVVTGRVRYCPHCGHQVDEGPFCPHCGHDMNADHDGGSERPRSRLILIGVGLALGAVVAAAVAVVLLSGGGTDANNVYRQKLTATLAPVLVANRALSGSLQSLSGTNTTAAQSADTQAQNAVIAARGAIAVLTVPSASTQLAQQSQQALTAEGGYLQAVSATLRNPTSANAAQLQPLATSTSAALVPLAGVAPGAQASLTGTDSLNNWVAGRVAAAARAQAAAARRAQAQAATGGGAAGTSGTSTPPAPAASGTDCGGGLHAGPNTTCSFAQNVRQAWYAAPGVVNTLQVYSPATGLTYTMSCAPAGSGITCSGGNGASVSW